MMFLFRDKRSNPRLHPLAFATKVAVTALAGGMAAHASAETLALAQPDRVRQSESTTLAPVVVTGEKIDRDLQESTSAVTVLDDLKVDTGETQSVFEVVDKVPNMIANPYGVPNIRGVEGSGAANGSFALVAGSRPKVSTSVDGVSESWFGQEYVDANLWDVQQVEVLRGPQSTTQGRNSIGGAIVVLTKDPTYHWESAVRAGYENADSKQQLALMTSGPLIDNELAFRLAASASQGEGYIDYPISDQEWPWDPSESKRYNLRGKLLWEPSALSGLSVKFTATHRSQEGEYLNFVNGDFFDYELNGDVSNTRYQDSDSASYALDVQYALNDALTAYLTLNHANTQAKFEEYASRVGDIDLRLDLEEKSNSLESRLVYDPASGPLSGVVGIYLFKRTQDLAVDPATFSGDDDVSTVAVYGDATFALTERLDLILGGRVERESQERNILAWPDTSYEGRLLTDIGETMFLPKAGVSYQATPQTQLGFVVRKGYNPGGGSLDWDDSSFYEYEKEEVITYEASSRSSLWDNRMTVGVTLFANEYDGYQSILNRRFVNIPEGRSYGLEVETNAQLAAGLEVFGSVGLLKTEVTKAVDGSPDIKGNEFGYAPSVNANLGFAKYFDQGYFAGADVSYVGEYYSDVTNNNDLTAGDYLITNVNAGYENDDFTVRLYVKNLFDEEVLYRQTTTWTSTEAQVGPPRTAGVVVDYRL
ncbi:TonB-dependent receptor [Hahella sp. KA22]|uniref:TonB-dependent receptor n=1 Tax=Hahella sp. KA22 TaxID=1628392 RepID=UPI000FDDB1CE|nr:TonB-dependent receptor [Hahella sp. KA22]AZZ92122.1 TonB-dependent receptor [Hahella sp. KA22]QAY55493.1 TonB-dependent receptor [Hahella sp. KA22]